MKKYIYSIAIAMTFLSVTSCDESQVEPIIQETLENERKAYAEFNSVDDYELLFEDPETVDSKADEVSRQFRTEEEITARSSEEEADTLYPAVLQKILNDDHIVKIEDWFIKIDALNEKVYVLGVEFEEEYQDLVSVNLNNENIRTFGTDEEVLILLKENTSSARRNTSQIAFKYAANSNETNTTYIEGGTNRRLKVNAKFRKYGIYFDLVCEASRQRRLLGLWVAHRDGHVTIEAKGTLKPRNKATKNINQSYTNTPMGQTAASSSLKIYQDLRRVKEYNITATAKNKQYSVSVTIKG